MPVIAILLSEVGGVGEPWEAAGEEEVCKEGREEEQCVGKSTWAKETGQVVQEEEEVGEQDLAGQGVGWGGRGGKFVCGSVDLNTNHRHSEADLV